LPRQRWNITVSGVFDHFRYKVADAAGGDCRDLRGYETAQRVSARAVIDDLLPQIDGYHFLCVLGGTSTRGRAAWQSVDHPTTRKRSCATSHHVAQTELREILGDIRDQSRRAGDVIERVRALAAKRPLQRQALDVNEVTGGIVKMVAGETRRRGVKLRTELGRSLPAIAADRVSLQQVMLNLMMNAMDATDQSEAEHRHVTVRTRRTEDGVEVAVSDTGCERRTR
jgi:signal transduction histidine kinase